MHTGCVRGKCDIPDIIKDIELDPSEYIPKWQKLQQSSHSRTWLNYICELEIAVNQQVSVTVVNPELNLCIKVTLKVTGTVLHSYSMTKPCPNNSDKSHSL